MDRLIDANTSLPFPMRREMCYPSPQFPNAGPFADYGLESFAQVEPFTSGCQSDVGIFASPKLSVPNGYLQLHGMGGPRGLAEYENRTKFSQGLNVPRENGIVAGPAYYSPMLRPRDVKYLAETSYMSQQTSPLTPGSPEMYPRYFGESSANYDSHTLSPTLTVGGNKFYTNDNIDAYHCPRECSPAQLCSHKIHTHMLTDSKSPRLECTCGKQFNSRSAAKRHCETQIPAFKCEVCHRYFTRQYNRNAHQAKCASRLH